MHDVTRRNQRRVDCGDYMDRDCPDRAYFVHKFPWWSLNLFMFRRCVLLWIPSLCATTARLPPHFLHHSIDERLVDQKALEPAAAPWIRIEGALFGG
jgi:hypothetical protein